MTNPTTAAGTPAADPYLRSEIVGGWSAQPDQRTLERERLESRAKGTDATSQLLRCFPTWTRPLGLDDHRADDLSRWLLGNPSQFDAGDLRCWRIGSATWLSLAGERLGAVGKVERPIGVFVVPTIGSSDGWQLTPVLALDTIR